MYFYKIIKVLSPSKFPQKLQREKTISKKRKPVVDISIYLTLILFGLKIIYELKLDGQCLIKYKTIINLNRNSFLNLFVPYQELSLIY